VIFDAHLHLWPPGVMREITPRRRKEVLTTFAGFTWEQATAWHLQLYRGKAVAGVIAFPLPLREARLEAANEYIAEVMRQHPRVKGFLLSDPRDVGRTVRQFEQAARGRRRFWGVKPYYDLLGKSNYETTMPEFIPEGLLEFMDRERLVMMLHTSGTGMGDAENQQFVKALADSYPGITIILAHMGRYLDPQGFFDFIASDVMDRPSVLLEMSSASNPDVYRAILARRELWTRLLFGSDLPFGLLTGVEHCSPETGPTFLTRDEYPWSDAGLQERFAAQRRRLTYNTYHVVKALKDAIHQLRLDAEEVTELKADVFHRNALRLFR
jgi:predicted TIM-barrel fold metal-dependent hydrolase